MLIKVGYCLRPKEVAPFTGAWIEIIIGVVDEVHEMQEVAPFTGAWIEMRQC